MPGSSNRQGRVDSQLRRAHWGVDRFDTSPAVACGCIAIARLARHKNDERRPGNQIEKLAGPRHLLRFRNNCAFGSHIRGHLDEGIACQFLRQLSPAFEIPCDKPGHSCAGFFLPRTVTLQCCSSAAVNTCLPMKPVAPVITTRYIFGAPRTRFKRCVVVYDYDPWLISCVSQSSGLW